MAFIFTMRSTPTSGDRIHRRDQPSGTFRSMSLPAISEDGDSFISPRSPPPVPPRAWNRLPHRHFGFSPPGPYHDGSPPAYNQFDPNGVEGSDGEKLTKARQAWSENKYITKRGGWKRLTLIALGIILVIMALVVGLVVGLPNKNDGGSSNSAEANANNKPPSGGASGNLDPGVSTTGTSNAAFPVGSYSINTYLSTIATNCTSNPSTWMCYPSFTYAQDATRSTAIFDWIISTVPNSQTYTISSSNNVFSILFSNASLALLNAGQPDEHYFFRISMAKPTKPATQIGDTNLAATCTFSDTTLHGNLYTKMEKTYPRDEAGHQGGYEPWPYAVKIEQVSGAGIGTPACKDPSGYSLGDFSVGDRTQLCDCLYLNTGT